MPRSTGWCLLRTNHGELFRSGLCLRRAREVAGSSWLEHLAWVPVETRPTDRICLLAGCAIPFVVRPVGQRYELLGDCYRDDMIEEKGLLISQEPYLFEFL